jgi:hypothetical protein
MVHVQQRHLIVFFAQNEENRFDKFGCSQHDNEPMNFVNFQECWCRLTWIVHAPPNVEETEAILMEFHDNPRARNYLEYVVQSNDCRQLVGLTRFHVFG